MRLNRSCNNPSSFFSSFSLEIFPARFMSAINSLRVFERKSLSVAIS